MSNELREDNSEYIDLVEGGGRLEEDGIASVLSPSGCINNNVGYDYFDRVGNDSNSNNNNTASSSNSNNSTDSNNNGDGKVPFRIPSCQQEGKSLDGGRLVDEERFSARDVSIIDERVTETVSASSAFAMIADNAADNGQGLDVHARHSWEAVFAKVGVD